jgi:isoleucyl-tRNA synthetase
MLLSMGLYLLRRFMHPFTFYVSLIVALSDGKKMSKSLKNYPDPNVIIDQYGADATR